MEGITITRLLFGLLTWCVILLGPVAVIVCVLLDFRGAPSRGKALAKLAAGVLLVAIVRPDWFPLTIAWYGIGLFTALVGTADLVVSQLRKGQ